MPQEGTLARILVIDDEDQVRRVLRRTLENIGHEVLEASNGHEGLRLHELEPADLVITDLNMPERDGIDVILTLRRESPQLRVIAISGGGRYKQTESLDMAKPLGAYATLQKPFAMDAMLELVRKALAA